MNNGAFGENFPYSNFHDLNMDWIIKIAKDFLDQYTHIQEVIANGEQSLQDLTASGLEQLQNKADALEALLQQWYDTHSADIANQLADALKDLNAWYTEHQGYLNQYLTDSITAFNQAADQKAQQTIASIPADYTTLSNDVTGLKSAFNNEIYDNDLLRDTEWIIGKYPNPSGSNLITSSGYKTSGYVPVSNGDTIYTNSNTTFLHVYDANKEWLYGAAMNNSRFVINNANAAFMRVGVGTRGTTNYYKNPSAYTEILENTSWTEGIYIEGGATHENDGYKTSDFIFVAPGTVFTKIAVNGCFVNYYGAYKDWIAGDASTSDTFTVPNSNNVYYMRVSIENDLTNPHIFGSFPQYIVYGKAAFDGYNKYAEMLANLSVVNKQPDIHIGSGQEYTTLRTGINAAMRFRDTKVYVHPGTYDLKQEFAAELAEATASHCGIMLGKGVHIVFYDGAKVICNLSPSDYTSAQWAWIAEHFEPFWVNYADRCDFTIENADIETTNTRYCVHDELAGINASYIHKFINCKMKKITTRAATEFTALQCIGGGIGKNATIIIDGGLYESVWTTQPERYIPTISYHNGNNNNADSSINVKNVYSLGKSYFAFTSYGPSTIESIASVNGCSTGAGVRPVQHETGETGPVNMKLYEFCNEVRIPGHWENGKYIEE